MSKQEIESILQIAQKLVDRLPKEMNDKLTELILSAKDKQDPTAEVEKIMSLLSPHENIRRWMREQTNLQRGQERTTRYSPLAGNPYQVPASEKWICPRPGCPESLPVIQANENAPICRVHKDTMVPDQKEG